jgi:hypothetical protein
MEVGAGVEAAYVDVVKRVLDSGLLHSGFKAGETQLEPALGRFVGVLLI